MLTVDDVTRIRSRIVEVEVEYADHLATSAMALVERL